MIKQQVTMDAVLMNNGSYAVRPEGMLGSCGGSPVLWTVQYIRARNAAHAIDKATPLYQYK